MPINTKRTIAAVAVASAAMGGLAGTVLSSPATAVAQEAEVTDEETRPGLSDAIEEALSPLVTDRVITQAQADAVTEALVENLPARGAAPWLPCRSPHRDRGDDHRDRRS